MITLQYNYTITVTPTTVATYIGYWVATRFPFLKYKSCPAATGKIHSSYKITLHSSYISIIV